MFCKSKVFRLLVDLMEVIWVIGRKMFVFSGGYTGTLPLVFRFECSTWNEQTLSQIVKKHSLVSQLCVLVCYLLQLPTADLSDRF